MAEFSDLVVLTIDDLEENLGAAKFRAFVEASEKRFVDQVAAVADRILENRSIRAIFVSGPTSSGKTTSSMLMSKRLTAAGLHTFHLELDDYYRPERLRFDADGRPDFESVDTIDLELLARDLERLFNHEEVVLPTFDFKNRERLYEPNKTIRLGDDDVLLIEGLHGLHDVVMNRLPREQRLSYFIMPHARVLGDRRMLSGSDIRILRRISRDVQHRGAMAIDTIDYWPMIDRAERDFIPRYLAAADYYINSVLPYEFMVVGPMARIEIERSLDQFFKGTLPPSSYTVNKDGHSDLKRAVKEAVRLSWVCEQLPRVTPSFVPDNSILQEFI
ncbi:MAG: uridine kinase family protein [Saccharofermentanales bacterium]|jgi:uridine kinase